MCNEMKGNIFALKLLMSYPDIIQYVLHILLLFILFLYWEMLKKVTVAITRHTEEAIVFLSRYLSRSGGFNKPHQGRDLTKEGLLPCRKCHLKCLLNVQIWSNFWQQSYSTLMYSTVKYVQRALVFYLVEIIVGTNHSCWYIFVVLRSAGYPHHHSGAHQLLSNSHETGLWC